MSWTLPMRTPSLLDQEQALARYIDALFAVSEPTPDADAREAVLEAAPATAPAIKQPVSELSLVLVRQGDLQLAFPLNALAAVRPAPEGYTRLPHSPQGVLGLYTHRGQHIPVVSVDYALDLRVDALASAPDLAQSEAQVLILGDGRWGLQIDQVMKSLRVPQTGVRWRELTERSSGLAPWLAGYLRVGLVSLIDVATLVERLDERRRGMETAFRLAGRD